MQTTFRTSDHVDKSMRRTSSTLSCDDETQKPQGPFSRVSFADGQSESTPSSSPPLARCPSVCGDDLLAGRYRIGAVIGRGAYGVVCRARDTYTGRYVAIKKIENAFSDKLEAKRTLREIKLLRHLRQHENVIQVLDILMPVSATRAVDTLRGARDASTGVDLLLHDQSHDVYIITELMETDMWQVIQSRQSLTPKHHKYFLYQILRALKFIHSAGVIHRDIKPSNLLANSRCDLKVCDFGLARAFNQDKFHEMTEYVVTRWYRAPELILYADDYTPAIDVWSVGCIFAELIDRRVLFPGDDYVHQLKLIVRLLGTPSEDDMDSIGGVQEAKDFVRVHFPHQNPVALDHVLGDRLEPAGIDLLSKMLVFNPLKRISTVDALRHPYFEGLHDEGDEPVCVTRFNYDVDAKLDTAEVKRQIIAEIIGWNQSVSAFDGKAAIRQDDCSIDSVVDFAASREPIVHPTMISQEANISAA